MAWSIPIGVIGGTTIRIHVTFLLLLLWIAVAHYAQGGAQAAVQGVAFVVLVFVCVVLHEFGHVFAARRYGVQTPDITLLPIGGVARLARIPERPGQELVVAMAGPLVNVVIAVLLYLALGRFPPLTGTEVENPGIDMLTRLAAINVFLVLFNLNSCDADGTVRAYVVTVTPEVAGLVVQLPVADNQFVHKGDLLMTIDPTDYAIAVDLAEAATEQANAENAKREAARRE